MERKREISMAHLYNSIVLLSKIHVNKKERGQSRRLYMQITPISKDGLLECGAIVEQSTILIKSPHGERLYNICYSNYIL